MTLLETRQYDSRQHEASCLGEGEREWVPVCPRAELENGWAEAALAGRHQVALVALADELYAVSHLDPHTGAPVMARGIVGSRKAEGEGHRPTIASPLLKQVYDLQTGLCYSDPTLFLECFRTRIVDDVIEVEVPV
ncbi:nitrite reductase (NAD(P)H) small subunit [Salinibacterium sp. SYSU T00001]|uniref:nitrite reductase (NAD(P)H) small subunit n=1 Tax=Homoserinimonas sedimenticola TaxID=2986805 RepID=UPI002236621A|nr:nitrite reductase (NAD(P)H) small subunit [Salinibacterium sedimenticola]MCW4384855.1 nitrite reductase (NAD(P)H) small subunit [Salinibacterium sedimenticola]